MKIFTMTIALLTAAAFAQTSQPAEQPADAALKAKIIKEAKSEYAKEKARLTAQKTDINKKISGLKRDNQKLAMLKIKEDDKCSKSPKRSRENYYAIIKKMEDNEAAIKQMIQTLGSVEIALAELNKLKPGKTYFRKLDKNNISDGDCGQIINGKILVEKVLDKKNIIGRIPVEIIMTKDFDPFGRLKKTYVFKQVKIEVSKITFRKGQYIHRLGVYVVTADTQGDILLREVSL